MQITNTNDTRSVADRNPDLVEMKDPDSEKNITAKSIMEDFEKIITYSNNSRAAT
jgi:hypothetical protein